MSGNFPVWYYTGTAAATSIVARAAVISASGKLDRWNVHCSGTGIYIMVPDGLGSGSYTVRFSANNVTNTTSVPAVSAFPANNVCITNLGSVAGTYWTNTAGMEVPKALTTGTALTLQSTFTLNSSAVNNSINGPTNSGIGLFFSLGTVTGFGATSTVTFQIEQGNPLCYY